jgi:long-chain acyl-CoA synthetase
MQGKKHSTIRELVDGFDEYKDHLAISFYNKELERINGINYKYIKDNVISIANFLNQIRLKKGDRGIVLSGNNPLWTSSVWGMQYFGMTAIPIDLNERGFDNTNHMIKHSDSKLLIVENDEIYDKLKSFEKKKKNLLKGIKEIIFINENSMGFSSLDDILKREASPNDFEIVKDNDIAMILYTSGTTGKPSGAMLSHGNLLFDAYSTLEVEPMFEEVFVSMIPLSHSFGNIESLISAITRSKSHYSSTYKLMEDLASQKPTKLVNSPLLLDKIIKKVDENLNQKKIINMLPDFIKYKLAGIKIKKKLGGNVTGIFVGGSKLTKDVQRKFWLMGINVMQGYGTTEASPICTAPRGQKYPGSIGLPLPGTEAMILDGELYVKGPHIMKSYFKNPKLTKEKLLDGWYKTGDFANKNRKGWIYITGRKDDRFKLRNGLYVDPIGVEKAISIDPFVDKIMVIGYERNHTVAIIVPDKEKLIEYFKIRNIEYDSRKHEEDLKEIYFNVINKRTKRLAKHEIPKQIMLINPSIFNNTLSFKKELRRKVLVAELNEQIIELYDSHKKILNLYVI